MALSLMECSRFFAARGMALNASKSVAITAACIKGTSVPRTKSIFRVGENPIRSVVRPTVFGLVRWLRNVERAPFKPHQKLTILKHHPIPRLLYVLQVPSVTAVTLAQCDRLVRKSVHSISAATPVINSYMRVFGTEGWGSPAPKENTSDHGFTPRHSIRERRGNCCHRTRGTNSVPG